MREVYNSIENSTCRRCHAYHSPTGSVYGRCSTHMMYDLDRSGNPVLQTERPVIRFETDCCLDFTKR
jgi:hypothetical protein